jgi:heme exporter protein CcmB
MRLFFDIVYWDFVREIRRRSAFYNMVLFGLLVLFVINLGLDPLFQLVKARAADDFLRVLDQRVGAVVFWVAVVFTGTVGLGQSLAVEREGGSLTGVLLAPIDVGIFYLGKVFATWAYVVLMEVLLLGAYAFLFHFDRPEAILGTLAALATFSLGYVAIGTIIAGMTSALRGGGEVLLRILLFPLIVPLIHMSLHLPAATLGVDVYAGTGGPPPPLSMYLWTVGAIDVIYLTTGYLVFPAIFRE